MPGGQRISFFLAAFLQFLAPSDFVRPGALRLLRNSKYLTFSIHENKFSYSLTLCVVELLSRTFISCMVVFDSETDVFDQFFCN